MSEIYLIGMGPTYEQHKAFVRWVNSRKYPFKGARMGYCRPFISKAELYSVKMKKEVVPLFLSDLKASTQEVSGKYSHVFGLMNSMVKWVIRIVNFFGKRRGGLDMIENIDMGKVKRGNDTLEGWFYTKVLGMSNDPIVNGMEEL